MTGWRAFVLVVVVATIGAIGTFIVGAATGMGGGGCTWPPTSRPPWS
jgi:hypothetical protein